MGPFLFIIVLLAVTAAAVFWPRRGLIARLRTSRSLADRALLEDFLKHIHARQLQGNLATTESLAGSLNQNRSTVVETLSHMEANGLISFLGSGITLTPDGDHLALQLVRAHRLLERYLFDELRMPLGALHAEADRREHALSPAEINELDARLGYPQVDPHGDPIPTGSGVLETIDSVALVNFPDGKAAEVVHLEDEPPELFSQILSAGLVPGMHIEILERTDRQLVLFDGSRQYEISALAATNVSVRPLPFPIEPPKRLTELKRGGSARIVGLESRGFARRRLLDLGLTPGTLVTREFNAPLGEPTAFRIRDALIALRREDAFDVFIEHIQSDEASEAASRRNSGSSPSTHSTAGIHE